jgi:N-acetylglucosamine malate deacetylase 2
MNWRADQQDSWEYLARELSAASPDPSLRILVLAAHPDDEVIGASTLLARFPQSTVAFLTDGAPRDEHFWTGGAYSSREEYAARRRGEAAQALAHANISAEQISWLGATDQEAVFGIPKLIDAFAKLTKEARADVVITHPYEGGHPDHDCAALVAALAISALDPSPQLAEMTSYHAENGQCITGRFLESQWTPGLEGRGYTHPLGYTNSREDSPPRLSALAPARVAFDLSDEDRQRKRNMFNGYASQRLVLQNFPTNREMFRPAPDYDFSQPPHGGKLWYECMGWQMTGARWRELAMGAIDEVREHSCP